MPPQHEKDRASPDDLLIELQGHNDFFDDLVDMIPAKLYVSGNTGDEMYNPKYRKGQHKESKEARRARNKAAKLAKFDPSKAETTLQAKERKSREDEEMSSSSDEDEVSSSNKDGGRKKGKGREKKAGGKGAKKRKGPSSALSGDEPTDGTSRIESLRAKLHAKIAEKRGQRPGGGGAAAQGTDATCAAVSKRAARRAEKQRRIDAAKARNHSNVGKDKAKKVTIAEGALDGGTKLNVNGSGSTSREEDLAGIDFGGIAGLSTKARYLENKSLANAGGKKKSLERLLEEAETKRKRLKELKAGSEEQKEKAARIEWGDTLKEASGERVRDDPALIKKAMKRKAKKKAKSAKAWQSRMDQAKDAKSERQKIRAHNLEKRKLGGVAGANLSKKRIDAEEGAEGGGETKPKLRRLGPHSGQGRVGFEGKKQEFINKSKGSVGKGGQSSQ